MPKVFISRDLNPDSVFRHKLEAEGYEVHGESLLEFELIPFSEIPETDWVFFYSKNGVKYYFEGLQHPDFWKGKKMKMGPPRRAARPVKYACYGVATAAYLKKHHGMEAQFIGSARPKSTSQALLTMAAGERILFPRARKSRQSLKRYLAGRAEVQNLVVYENHIRKDFEIPECDVLVFTSPMNAEAYYGKYRPKKNQLVISIGRTTGRKLKKLGVAKVKVASKPQEAALASLVLKF